MADKRILVVGLGNPILTDDGVGVLVAYEVERILDKIDDNAITVTEASVGGLRLMELMIGYGHVILVDAFCPNDGSPTNPGQIHHMTFDDLKNVIPTQHSASAHDTSLVTAFDIGASIGLNLPKTVSIYAVEVENIYDFGEEPTPAVAAAIPRLVTAILDELEIKMEKIQ